MPVEVPVHVALPGALTEPVADAPVPSRLTNDGLIGLAESEKCRKRLANCKLDRIESLQPGGARRALVWCERYEKACKGGVP